MTRALLVAQDKGGSGKTTMVRAVAEAVPGITIVEVDISHRLIEFDAGKTQKEPRQVHHFPMRASVEEIERSGGLAARAEFDGVVNMLGSLQHAAVVDIGANTGKALMTHFAKYKARFEKRGLELGVLVVTTNDPASLQLAKDLLIIGKKWADKLFVVENRLHGPAEPKALEAFGSETSLRIFEAQKMDPAAVEILQARGLRDIAALDADKLEDAYGMARGARIQHDLERFRYESMVAVQPAAEWLVG